MLKSFFLIIALFTFQTLSLAAQATLEQDKQALRDIKTVYEKAMASGDLTPLKPFLAKDFSAIMITGDQVNSYSELEAFWKKSLSYLGDDAKYSVTMDPDNSLFIDNIALSSGHSSDEVTGSNSLSFKTTWSAVSQKQTDGSWKLLRIQVTTHPIENPFSEAFYKFKTILYASIAFVIALLLGIFIGKKKSRKREK